MSSFEDERMDEWRQEAAEDEYHEKLRAEIEDELRNDIEEEVRNDILSEVTEDKCEAIKSIEFPQEYHQAGVNILSYFGEIVRRKYKEEKIILKIEQEGLIVRMIIKSPDGKTKERIEKTLEKYLMVITGEKNPEDLLDSKLKIIDLKNQLTNAIAMVKSKEDVLQLEREYHREIVKEKDSRINSLEEFKGIFVKSILDGRETKEVIAEIRKLTEASNKPVVEALEIINQKIEKGISNDDEEKIKKVYEKIKEKEPNVLGHIQKIMLKATSSTASRYLIKWLSTIKF